MKQKIELKEELEAHQGISTPTLGIGIYLLSYFKGGFYLARIWKKLSL